MPTNRRYSRILFVSALVLAGSVSHSEGRIEKYPGLRDRTDEYIIARVGEDYFREHFGYVGLMPYPKDMPTSGERIAWYDYTISVGDYRQVVRIAVWVRWSGLQWRVERAESLPDCMPDSSKCMPYHTTRDEALAVAHSAGAFDGALRFSAGIHFYGGDINSYVWGVTTYLSACDGESAIVSLARPEILVRSKWHAYDASCEFDSVFHKSLENARTYKPIRIK